MKNPIVCASFLALMASTISAAEPIVESKTWTQTYPVATASPHLVVSNIWGNVRVRAGTVGEISVTIDETRSAPTRKLFDRSLEMMALVIEADSNGVSLLVGGENRNWNFHNRCRECRVDYQFEILVPPGTQVDVGTVTDGRIDVVDVAGTISASNVNGPVYVRGLRDCEVLESVNGAVDISFSLAPGQDCNISTVNGDIIVNMPDGTGVDIALDLFNGRMITDFQVDSYAIPAQVEQSTKDGRLSYKIQQSAGLRLEGGGPTFSVSSLNGDIRFQKN
jgi:hypothetical protein